MSGVFLGGVLRLLADPVAWGICLLLASKTRSRGYAFRLAFMLVVILSVSIVLRITWVGEYTWQDFEQGLAAYLIVSSIVLLIFRHKPSLEQQLCTIVGTDLHRQIHAALTENEVLAGKRLNNLASTGYIFGFINAYLEAYPEYEPKSERMFKQILNGVLPNKLMAIFVSNYERYCIALDVERLKQEVEDFKLGVSIGASDAEKAQNYETPQNLELYLKGKKPITSPFLVALSKR